MKPLLLLLLLSTALTSLLSSCSSTTEAARTTGTIAGDLRLYEMDCSSPSSFAGAKVEMLGTDFQCFSDSTGFWSITNVPMGYYTFRFTKPGFTQLIYSDISFLGVDTLFWTSLGWTQPIIARINNFTLTPGTIYIQKNGFGSDTNYSLSISFSGTDSLGHAVTPQYLVFVGRDSTVDYRVASSYFATGRDLLQLGSSNLKLHSGQTLYARAYATNCVPPTYNYIDHNRNAVGWSGLGKPTALIAITLP